MSDRPGGGTGEGPSEEEVRAYLAEMRGTPVTNLVAEIVSGLANGAQVKAGRKDARLLIDLVEVVARTAGPHLDPRFAREVDQVLAQLRMAQVEAEDHLRTARERGEDVDEPNDLASAPAPGTAAGAGAATSGPDAPAPTSPTPPPASGGTAASRLWVPGR